MVAHLTDAEKDLVERITRHKKGSVTEALEAVNKRRVKKGEEPVTRSPVYRYVSGGTHTRKSEETRGRPLAGTRLTVLRFPSHPTPHLAGTRLMVLRFPSAAPM